jgi:hypothetical protein
MAGADLHPDVMMVIRALAIEMRGKPVEPRPIHDAMIRMGEPLPGHTVVIHHVPRSPKGTRPRVFPHYVLTVAGQLSELLKSAET